MPSQLYLHVVRSPYAHARIKKIDVSDAVRKAQLVLTSDVLPGNLCRMGLSVYNYPKIKIQKMPVLASTKANFVGEPVAAVVASDRYEAEDLAEAISVDYEPLDPVVSPEKALDEGSIEIHSGTRNVALDVLLTGGNPDLAFKNSDLVVEDTLSCHRVAPNPLETRGVIANWIGDNLKVILPTQGVFKARQDLSEILGVSEQKIHVEQPDVGGAFGTKSAIYQEYVIACCASMMLKRPIKWIETRSEHLIATSPGRDVKAHIKLAARSDGKILGLSGRVVADIGAYTFSTNTTYAPFVAQQLTGPYSTGSAEVQVLSVFTNKTPLGPYRGAGRPEAAFFYERMMDLLAEELRIDPAEIRKRNLVRAEEMPYRTPLGLVLDLEHYHEIFRHALDTFEYEKKRAWQIEQKKAGNLVGLGLCTYIELNRASQGESARVMVRDDGGIVLATGSDSHGQSHETILAQLLADEFGLDLDKIEVKFGDTSLLPRGTGTYGSRSTVIGGAATVMASRELKKKIIEKSAELSGIPQEHLRYERGDVLHKDGQKVETLKGLKEHFGSLESFVFYTAQDIFSFGVHLISTFVDPETGQVKIRSYHAVDDAGKVVNPLLAEAQVIGGAMQGIGQVLYEELSYDDLGSPIVGSIGDAGVPTAVESIEIKSDLYEDPSNFIHGARGIGEAGTIGSMPALVASIESAIGRRLSTTMAKPELIRTLLIENQ